MFVRVSSPSRACVAVTVLSLVVAAACRPESSVTSDHSLTRAVVYGRVLTAAGAPVPGATVRANVHGSDDTCRPGGPGLTGGGPVTTDAEGRYRQRVSAPLAPAEFCVSAQAIPAVESGLPTAGVGGVRVRMRPDTGPLDSAQADIRLP